MPSTYRERSWRAICLQLLSSCLNKCCELKEHFLHVWHGTDQTIIDNAIDEWHGCLCACVRAKDGHFEQLLWQYSAIGQATFQFLSNVTQYLDFSFDFFWKLPQIRTSNFRKVAWQHTKGMVGGIIWVLVEIFSLSSSERILKIHYELTKVIAMSLVYYFFETQCISMLHGKIRKWFSNKGWNFNFLNKTLKY